MIQFTTLWMKWNNTEKWLFVICIFLLSILLIISVTVMYRKVGHKDVCLTKHCIKVAGKILSNMDESVNPCHNFYEYACGGWKKTYFNVGSTGFLNEHQLLMTGNKLVVKKLLEKPLNKSKSEAEAKAKRYYLSCMDANGTIEALGAKPLLDVLENIGGWNVSGKFDVNNWSLQKIMQVVHNEYRLHALFQWKVFMDYKNSSRYLMQITEKGLVLPRDYYLNKTEHKRVLDAYLEYLTKFGILLGGDKDSTRNQMQDVINFEIKIAEISPTVADKRITSKFYNRMTLSELQKSAPFISWVDFFQNATNLINKTIDDKMLIINKTPHYFSNLTKIINEYKSTTKGKIILNNFLITRLGIYLSKLLSKPFKENNAEFIYNLLGTDERKKRWDLCIDIKVMKYAFSAIYVRNNFEQESKTKVKQMFNNIISSFVNNFRDLRWMDAKTRKLAIKKAHTLALLIGFPDFILNPEKLDEYYQDLTIKENEYFMNYLRVKKFDIKTNLKKLDKPTNKRSWLMNPFVVDAYYEETFNEIAIPAGILQSPYFHVESPHYLNYGAAGAVMGHEITHAFDDQGSTYDWNGNLDEWWDNATLHHFRNKTKCFIKQYSDYVIRGNHLRGEQTIGEDISDNGGLKAAFNAYLKTHKHETSLPGLNLTHRQLFFVNYAQSWCSTITPEALKLEIIKGVHTVDEARVILTLWNSKDFAREFKCPLGSKMNPVHKCEIW